MRYAQPFILMLLAMAVLGACSENTPVAPGAVHSSFEVVTNDRFHMSFSEFNPCTNEYVDLEGYVHSLFRVSEDGDGGFHVGIHINWQGVSGTGRDSGVSYQLPVTFDVIANARPPFPSTHGVQNVITNNQFVSTGPDDDFSFKFRFTLVIDANGNVRVADTTLTMECL